MPDETQFQECAICARLASRDPQYLRSSVHGVGDAAYSKQRAVIGSTRVARFAGIQIESSKEAHQYGRGHESDGIQCLHFKEKAAIRCLRLACINYPAVTAIYAWQSRTRCWRNLRIIAGEPPVSSTERIAPDIAASIICMANSSGEVLMSGAD